MKPNYKSKKEKNWFEWKADSLISGFQRRHKKNKIPYTYYTVRKDYAKIIENSIKFTCYYCGEELNRKNFSVDHRIPLSRGGDTTDENLCYCCSKCNNSKGIMTEKEFNELLELINSWEDKGKSLLGRLRSSGRIYIPGKKKNE